MMKFAVMTNSGNTDEIWNSDIKQCADRFCLNLLTASPQHVFRDAHSDGYEQIIITSDYGLFLYYNYFKKMM